VKALASEPEDREELFFVHARDQFLTYAQIGRKAFDSWLA
jgi:hypothetical protein